MPRRGVTDTEGRCVVIGVRPGIRTLVVTFLGFTSQRSKGVRVSVDVTTEADLVVREQETGVD